MRTITAPARSTTLSMVLRLTGLTAGFLALAIAASVLDDVVLDREVVPAPAAVLGLLAAIALTAAAWGLVRALRPRGESAVYYGLAPTPGWSRQLAVGVGLGAALLGFVAAVDLALGQLRPAGFEMDRAGVGLLAALVAYGLTAALAGALLEEVVFRGSWLTEASRRLPLWGAVIVVSIPFALLHLVNEGFTAGFAFAALVGSAFFVATRVLTGSLAFAIGFHTAWNFVQYAVLGIATTTTAWGGHALVQFERTGSPLLLGTGRSIEGGLVAGGVLAVAAVVAWGLLARRGIRLSSHVDTATRRVVNVGRRSGDGSP